MEELTKIDFLMISREINSSHKFTPPPSRTQDVNWTHKRPLRMEFNLSETILPRKQICLTLSWRVPLSYRNQSIRLQSKSMDWFLYDNGLRHERVKFPFWISFWYWEGVEIKNAASQLTFTCSKSTIETLEKGVKYVQS